MPSWEHAYKTGQCNEVQSRFWLTKPVEELYDTENDPWEIHNLASDPAHANRLATMRSAIKEMGASMKDAGYIPEADRSIRAADVPIYDYMRSDGIDHDAIMDAAWLASEADPENLDRLIQLLDHNDGAIRYWAAQGLLLLGNDANGASSSIEKAAFDEFWNVSVVAAETLYRLGHKKVAVKAMNRVLDCDYPMARTFALNSIDHMDGTTKEFLDGCIGILSAYETLNRQYDARVSKWLLEKWEVDAAAHGVEFNW